MTLIYTKTYCTSNAIIVYTEEKRTAQTIGKCAHAFEPALGFVSFKHHFEIICRTFRVFKSIFTTVVMFAYAVVVYQLTMLQLFIKSLTPHRHNSLEFAVRHIRVDNVDLIVIVQGSTYRW